MGKYKVDIPKTVLIILPIVFFKAGQAIGRERLLEAGSFSFDYELPMRFPQENWNELFSSCYTACKLAQDQVVALSEMAEDEGANFAMRSRDRSRGSSRNRV